MKIKSRAGPITPPNNTQATSEEPPSPTDDDDDDDDERDSNTGHTSNAGPAERRETPPENDPGEPSNARSGRKRPRDQSTPEEPAPRKQMKTRAVDRTVDFQDLWCDQQLSANQCCIIQFPPGEDGNWYFLWCVLFALFFFVLV